MRRPTRLSAAFVKTATAPGRYGDGRGGFGLSLLVQGRKDGGVAKSWSQRLWIAGKAVNGGLGAYPIVTLSQARAKALDNRRMVERGEDPRKPRRSVPTFAAAAAAVIELHRPTWKGSARTEVQWLATLRDYALPVLGDKRVDIITTADILAALTPIWSTVPAAADRARTRISAVMKWAIAEGHRADNPAGEAITAALPRQNGGTRHHRAAAHGDMADVLATVRDSGAWIGARLALSFCALTSCRANEVLGATWSEVDLESATWTIPADRMKTKREHRVPLSTQALRVLDEAREAPRRGGDLVFPAPRGGVLYNKALLELLDGTGTTTHGFRSAFSSWCADSGTDREVREAALAHVVGGTEGAYMRSDLYERRRELMQTWADYIMPGT